MRNLRARSIGWDQPSIVGGPLKGVFVGIVIAEPARRGHDLYISFLARPEIQICDLIEVDTVGLDSCGIVARRNIAVECPAKLRDAGKCAVERDSWPPLIGMGLVIAVEPDACFSGRKRRNRH